MPELNNAVNVTNLTKLFTRGTNLFDDLSPSAKTSKIITALKDISFSIKKGEVAAIVGTNGAGKTTLLKLLSSLLLPDSGDIYINGYNTKKDTDAIKSIIGFASSDNSGFYHRLSIKANLLFYSALYNIKKDAAEDRINELCRYFDITDIDKRFQECSTGIKQRCILARSILHNPEVIFLDEPTRSLDPCSAKKVRGYIHRLVNEEKKTIVFTTHIISEAEEHTDKIIIMDKGEILAQGDIDALKITFGTKDSSLEKLFLNIVKVS